MEIKEGEKGISKQLFLQICAPHLQQNREKATNIVLVNNNDIPSSS